MKQSYLFGGMTEAPERVTTRATIHTIYTFNTKEVKVATVRDAPISLGTINESIAHPREVFRPAIVACCYALIVMHNHPSGDPSPSQADHSLTRRLAEAAELLQIKLLDHVIIGEQAGTQPGYFSFKEAGVL